MNRRAEAFLQSHKGLSAAANKLCAPTLRQTAHLRDFISQAASTITGNGRHPGGVITIRRSGSFPLKLHVTPLASSSQTGIDRRPAVAIFFAAQEQPVSPDAAVLGALLELSPAEARLTAALVCGKTLQQFATEAAVSISTARTLLSRVFSKTGASRQAELVSLALTRGGGAGWARS